MIKQFIIRGHSFFIKKSRIYENSIIDSAFIIFTYIRYALYDYIVSASVCNAFSARSVWLCSL